MCCRMASWQLREREKRNFSYIIWILAAHFHSFRSIFGGKSRKNVAECNHHCCVVRLFGGKSFCWVKIYLIPNYSFVAQAADAQKVDCKEGPPRDINPINCCLKAKTIDDSILNVCFTKHGRSVPRPERGLRGEMNGHEVQTNNAKHPLNLEYDFTGDFSSQCVFECILNATKAFENSKINPRVLIERMTTALKQNQQEWTPVVTASVNYCLGQVNQNAEKLKSSMKGEVADGISICSPTSAFFLGCTHAYEFRNCPGRLWNPEKDPKCNDLKRFYDQCPTPLMNWYVMSNKSHKSSTNNRKEVNQKHIEWMPKSHSTHSTGIILFVRKTFSALFTTRIWIRVIIVIEITVIIVDDSTSFLTLGAEWKVFGDFQIRIARGSVRWREKNDFESFDFNCSNHSIESRRRSCWLQ